MESYNLELSLGLKPTQVPKAVSGIPSDAGKPDHVSEKIEPPGSYLRQFKEKLSQVRVHQDNVPQAVAVLENGIRLTGEGISKVKESNTAPAPPKLLHKPDIGTSSLSAPKEGGPGLQLGPALGLSHHAVGAEASFLNSVPGIRLRLDRFRGFPRRVSNAVLPQNPRPGPRAPLLPRPMKKQRKCWCLRLHSMFLEADEVLGGPEEAEPEEIPRIMEDDAVTDEQVNCHLGECRAFRKQESLQVLGASLDKGLP